MSLRTGPALKSQSWTDLRVRLISALVLGCFVLAIAVIGGVLFRLLCCAAAIVVFEEWSQMTRARRAGPLFKLARRALLFALFAFLLGANAAALAIVVAASAFIAFVDRREHRADWTLGGLVYASLAGFAPGMLRGDDAAGLAVLGLVITVVWSSDIFAYFTGRALGGPKIMPSVSPKKTISGCLGGLLAGVVLGTLFAYAATGEVHVWMLLLTACLSILGQAGDLFESWIKRHFGVKDSGRIIPGHGGLMDRIDALIVALAAAWIVGMALNGLDHPARALFDL
ncbi:phosphatidate cytidylyltransferase [Aureimonas glaciei]|uniref:Phosphatidate cytidylyltransferase n=1 Tax=Aureimonas glaciei TaxID=1776957 RepID=A0A916YBX0_9HYPH|nr:phosphatidate cytidylyltransferase [Aureimonas glaciei]GGD39419.1 phosphatidate cytidylyltransferase [Aureimonas glaciei]